MCGGHTPTDDEADDVVVTSGDVTSISESESGADALATGGESIAASLSADADMLNIAFVTGGGDVQIIQITVDDVIQGGATASAGEVIVSGDLTALSGEVISSGAGAATPMGTVAVAANLDGQGALSLSFVDGNGDLQLIETNVAELVQRLNAVDGESASPSAPGAPEP